MLFTILALHRNWQITIKLFFTNLFILPLLFSGNGDGKKKQDKEDTDENEEDMDEDQEDIEEDPEGEAED